MVKLIGMKMKQAIQIKLLLQVHDELIFETTEKNVDETRNFIINTMMYVMNL